MAAIMNPISGSGSNELLRLNKISKLKTLRMHPNAPRVHSPDAKQLDALVTYWTSVLKHLEKILLIQRYEPDYMPKCEMLEVVDGRVTITILTNQN